jgi:hypothetical protein
MDLNTEMSQVDMAKVLLLLCGEGELRLRNPGQSAFLSAQTCPGIPQFHW